MRHAHSLGCTTLEPAGPLKKGSRIASNIEKIFTDVGRQWPEEERNLPIRVSFGELNARDMRDLTNKRGDCHSQCAS
jgi:hypothetical protein